MNDEHMLSLSCGCGAKVQWTGKSAHQKGVEERWYAVHAEHQRRVDRPRMPSTVRRREKW